MDHNSRLKSLNSEQLEAVNWIDGPLVVKAGPGTGKTQILTTRIENILKSRDILPENILCLTFTESAAENMRQRLFNEIGKPARQVNFYTFHSFGTHLITKLSDYSDQTNLQKPIEEITSFEIIENLLNELGHTNPLSRRNEEGFYYIKYLNSVFSWLKQSGLDMKSILDDIKLTKSYFDYSIKPLTDTFTERISKKQLPNYQRLFNVLKDGYQKYPSISGTLSLKELSSAIDDIEMSDSTKSITAWKSRWINKNQLNQYLYKDQRNIDKFKATIDLLDKYRQQLDKKGQYDFDDMILKAVESLENNLDFKLNVQEQYQYILVDEYQDTNGVQNKLLNLLCDNPIYEGKPNLMVVGDPNQAIFSFQGADSSLLTRFAETWPGCKQVTLIKNYRSGQRLLDFSKSILDLANDDSENDLLIASNSANKTEIKTLLSDTPNDSYFEVSNQIQKLIKSGVEPKDISIISKEHRQLVKTLPFITELNIPVSYERDNNILKQPRILEIIDLINLIHAISNSQLNQVNSLLAKVLSEDYWQLPTETWWDIALDTSLNYRRWIDAVETTKNLEIKMIWEAFKTIAKLAKSSSFELIFNLIIGAKPIGLGNKKIYTIPWLDFNFQKNEPSNTDFVSFINQFNRLKMFFTNWIGQDNQTVMLDDFIRFIRLIDKSYIKLIDRSAVISTNNAVTLTTAYKAKGEEWDYVFVLDCNNKLWSKIRGGNLNQFNIPIAYQFIEPASYLKENIVKPFYVSVTRAKKQLILNNYNVNENGVSTELLDWIDPKLSNLTNIPSSNKAEIINFINKDWQSKLYEQKIDYKQSLGPILDKFKLSATHLNNYLEITDEATNSFIFKSLLKIPQVVKPKMLYGISMHNAISYLHKINFNDKRVIPVKDLIEEFYKYFNNSALTPEEIDFYRKKGHDELTVWYKHHRSDFNPLDLSEYKINQVYLDSGQEKLTGEIDLIKFGDKHTASIVDYKSSSPPPKDYGLQKGTKEYRYRRQLLFYKILLENIKFAHQTSPIQINEGIIEFLTPNESGLISDNRMEFDIQEIIRMKQLIKVVWKKIMNLEIIDTSKYENTIKGMIALEDDLIKGKL